MGSFRDLNVYKKAFDLAMEYLVLLNKSEEIGRMLNHMIENPEKYSPRKQ